MTTNRPLTLTVEQTAQLLGISRSTAYELVNTGQLECLRLRRRLAVPTSRVAEWLGVSMVEIWSSLRDDRPF
ncbi:MAG: helix-turn-helix domain-containing protein [Microthrixaceae bacterium]